MARKFGVSFSAKRALGISAMKGKISRATGIPLTRQGRQRKVGKATGCLVPVIVILSSVILAVKAVWALSRR